MRVLVLLALVLLAACVAPFEGPLRLYVTPDAPEAVHAAVHRAVTEWQTAGAPVVVSLVPDGAVPVEVEALDGNRAGRLWVDGATPVRLVLSGTLVARGEDAIVSTVLHEVGHAFVGGWHSASRDCLMYPSADDRTVRDCIDPETAAHAGVRATCP